MPSPELVRQRLDAARRELLDLTTRNRLLNTPRRNPRARALEIVDERADEVFRILVGEHRLMTFQPAPDPSSSAIENQQSPITSLPRPFPQQLPLLPDAALQDDIFDPSTSPPHATDAPAASTAQAAPSEMVPAVLPQPEDDDVDERGIPRRHTDARLRTLLSSEALQKRLLGLYYDARTSQEEQGVNILYLALGFLKWYAGDKPERPLYAPLLLLPAVLERRSANTRFRVRWSEEDIATNLSLRARLKTDFGLDLPEVPEADDMVPSAYFANVARVVAGAPRWEVLADDIVLSFFSFAKLLMYRDLDPDAWPRREDGATMLESHPLVVPLLFEDGFRPEPPLLPDDSRLDDAMPPADLTHVLDADGSQAVVVHEVRRGRSIVVQGPPGTGKSQTIVNLIAAAVRDGKKVLFVAEKQAALEVVKRRLDRIRLGEVCLELHSHKASRRAVLDDLRRTLDLAPPATENLDRQAESLARARDRLNRHAERLHRVLSPSGMTPYRVLGELSMLRERDVRPPDFTLDGASQWTPEVAGEREGLVRDAAVRAGDIGIPAAHPWRGVMLEAVTPMDARRVADCLPKLIARLEALQAECRDLATVFPGVKATTSENLLCLARLAQALARAPRLDRTALANAVWNEHRNDITALVAHGTALRERRVNLRGVLAEVGWDADVRQARRDLAAWGRSWLRRLNGFYRRAQSLLRSILVDVPPKDLDARLAILDDLIAAQEASAAVRSGHELGRAAFGELWRGENSDWDAIEAANKWDHEVAATALPAHWRALAAVCADPAPLGVIGERIGTDVASLLRELRTLFLAVQMDTREAFGGATPGRDDSASILWRCPACGRPLKAKLGLAGRPSQCPGCKTAVTVPDDDLETLSLADLLTRQRAWEADPEGMQRWIAWRVRRDALAGAGLGAIAERMGDGRFPSHSALDALRAARLEALWRAAVGADPELAAFDGRSHDRLVDEFRALDLERISLVCDEVALAHHRAIPRGTSDIGELGVLRREIHKKRRHLPIRQLMKQAGRAVQAVKPVFMMSPLSVAQFLEPGTVAFDVLLIDEASQIPPVDALGAMARARQAVVVGDNRQLPPTRFFSHLTGDTEAELEDPDTSDAADLESVLDLCIARGLPSRMLRWHYRSRHHTLIAVSNREFYESALYIVPSPIDPEEAGLGLRFHAVAGGVYERSGSRTNLREAEFVARAVLDHARRNPGLSLGVAAFSVAQRDAILDEIERLRRDARDAESFFAPGGIEPFFVKNLESVQGDERDVIFVSVGYGRDASGIFGMNFGPVSAAGGERRLNVLITRARRRCEVFASITDEDIDPARATGAGPRALKTFLRYARTGELEAGTSTGRDFESPFEQAVAHALSAAGRRVEPQVGVAGFFIDLAVVDPNKPGRYLLGIECDGASYHSARWARDRDRLRQQVLEDHGWTIHRIWSTDWFLRPQEELRRALAAIERARVGGVRNHPIEATAVQAVRNPSLDASSGSRATDVSGQPDHDPAVPSRGDVGGRSSVPDPMLPYREAAFPVPSNIAIHELAQEKLVEIVSRIVRIEGPIHPDEVARRVTTLWGLARTGGRIGDAVRNALFLAERTGSVVRDGDFYLERGLRAVPVRDRSNVSSPSLRDPETLPPAEISAALAGVVRDYVGATRDEVLAEAARRLGFRALGSQLRERLAGDLDRLVATRKVEETGTGLRAAAGPPSDRPGDPGGSPLQDP